METIATIFLTIALSPLIILSFLFGGDEKACPELEYGYHTELEEHIVKLESMEINGRSVLITAATSSSIIGEIYCRENTCWQKQYERHEIRNDEPVDNEYNKRVRECQTLNGEFKTD